MFAQYRAIITSETKGTLPMSLKFKFERKYKKYMQEIRFTGEDLKYLNGVRYRCDAKQLPIMLEICLALNNGFDIEFNETFK